MRLRSGGLAPACALAIVAALGFVVTGGPGASSEQAGAKPGIAGTGNGTASVAKARSVPTGAAIPDVPWLVQTGDGRWAYGDGAGMAPRFLPAGETGLAIDGRWLASMVPGADGHSTVRVRDRSNGRIAADVAAPIWVSAGAFAQAGLVVTGYGDGSMTADGGLLLISPADWSVRVLVGAGAFSARLGVPVARGDVLVSPSGTRVASNACGLERCDTQVVDVATGTVSRPIQGDPGFLRAVTDDTIVTTDGDYAWISARRVADGAEVWRVTDSVLLDPIAGADGSVVGVVGSARTGWGVASIDAAGHARNLTGRSRGPQTWPRIWTALSTATQVVVGSDSFADTIGSGRTVPVTVLAVHGGGASSTTSIVRLPTAPEATR